MQLIQKLSFIDFLVFSLIILLTFLSVWYGHRKKGKSDFLDYMLMGRSLSLPLFVCTLVSTWYGGIFGVTEIAYKEGIYNFITQGVFWYASYLIIAFLLIRKMRFFESLTLPDLISKIAGKKSAKLSALLNLFNIIPIAYTISIGLFISSLFGTDLASSMLIGLSFVICYSFLGGFRAVVYSDLIQFFVMCISVLIIVIFSIKTFGGISFLTTHLPPRYFSPTGSHSLLETLSWGLLALSTLVDPNFYQRIFAASSDRVAKRGIIISTFIWIIFDLCTTFGAMYARAAYPNLEPGTAYLEYALIILPSPLKGFVLAGILATILSTLDSYLFLSGNTLSYDILNLNTKKISRHKLSMIIIALISYFLAQFFDGNIKSVWKLLGSLCASSTLLPTIINLYRPHFLSDNQFLTSAIIGMISVICAFQMKTNTDALYIGIFSNFFVIICLKALRIFEKEIK